MRFKVLFVGWVFLEVSYFQVQFFVPCSDSDGVTVQFM